jgi:hypothetical protein
MVLAAVCGVVAVVKIVHVFDDVLVFSANRGSAALHESGDFELFAPKGQAPPTCRVTSAGARVSLRQVASGNTVGTGNVDWQPFARFTAPHDGATITCHGELSTQVRVGAPLDDHTFIIVGLGVVGAIGLAFVGFIWLLVVAILWFTRPSRRTTG